MTDDLLLPRKWTLKAHGRRVVFVKRPVESSEHVVMKALLWALYLPQYPDLAVEVAVGGRYKPDLVSPPEGRPSFWGEAGQVSVEKVRTLLHRFPATHFAFGKWDARLDAWAAILESVLEGERRRAPVDLIRFPADSAERFIDEGGHVAVTHDDLEWRRF